MDMGTLKRKKRNIELLIKIGGAKAFFLKIEDKITNKHKTMKYLKDEISKASPENRPELLEQFYQLVTGKKLLFDNPASYDEKIVLEADGARIAFLRSEAALKEDYPCLISKWYKYATGETIDLNNPKSFNEKIQWMKLNDSTQLKTKLADKYLARGWISERVGEQYLVPLLGAWDSFDEIDFEMLPDRFALKCNHGCGWNFIVNDKSSIDMSAAKKTFDDWMETNYAFCSGFELHYRDIRRKIIAEKFLEMKGGVKDYRFYCFNGRPTQVWVDLGSGTPEHIRSIYDMNWNKIDFRCTWPDGGAALKNKPFNFELMKNLAAKLSKEFAFVRVDFFEIDKKLYIGELTFTPMSGIGRFDPNEWDLFLGKLLRLPHKARSNN